MPAAPRPDTSTTAIRLGAVLGLVGVAAGAFGAHALDLAEQARQWWSTATEYQMYHALALLLCGALARGRRAALPVWCFGGGTLVFSGSLYAMALGAPRWFGAITPIGGTLFLVGWLAMLPLARPQAGTA